MSLSLERIRREAKKLKEQERALANLKSELKRVFGSTLDVDRPILLVIREANQLLDDPARRETLEVIKPSVTLALVEHSNPAVRLFVARTMPVKYVDQLSNDSDMSVRWAVARRVLPNKLDEMRKRHPTDDQLTEIARSRGLLLTEAKKDAKKDPDWKKLGQSSKQWEGPELSDTWYDTQAQKLIQRYSNNLEYCWEEIAVRRFVASTKATSGVEIDEKKLYDVLKKKISEREDWRLDGLESDPLREHPLKETLDWLRRGGNAGSGMLLPVLEEEDERVQKLVNSRISAQEYVRQFNSLFGVQESKIPRAIGKYRIGESRGSLVVPVKAHIPGENGIRSIDERALDRYVTSWNEIHNRGDSEPIKVSWSPDLFEQGLVTFDVILK